MTTQQSLILLGLASLVLATFLGRRLLRTYRGLLYAFAGLFISASGGAAIAYTRTPALVWLFAFVMLGGIGFPIWSLHVSGRQKRGHQV